LIGVLLDRNGLNRDFSPQITSLHQLPGLLDSTKRSVVV
jgi:hypothetical protein